MASILGPDFLILGWRSPDAFWVLGSNHMDRMLLQQHAEEIYAFERFEPISSTNYYELEGRLISFTLAHGGSYQEALSRLLQAWSPGDDRRSPLSIPPPQGAIGTPSPALPDFPDNPQEWGQENGEWC